MASNYRSTSDGSRVLDDIADRRHRTHYVKDRRASMEKRDNVMSNGLDDRRARYKAWGRTPSGILEESVMTPKETNLIWAWYCGAFPVEHKFDYIDIDDFFEQLLTNCVFEDEADTLSFIESIGKEKKGLICFNEITTSIGNYNISPDHIFALRQFGKKLKAKRKERKKRISNYKMDANFLQPEEETKGIMLKSKSESGVGMLPRLSLHDDGNNPSSFPEVRPNSSAPKMNSPKRPSGNNSKVR